MFLTRHLRSQLPEDLDVDTAMHHLSLSPNGEHQSQHIPNEDECPCYLDSLNLRRRNLEHPSEIIHYLSLYASMSYLLVELDLSRNGLSDLPLEIYQLTNLRQLNLACNRFAKLPSVLYSMSNLKHLDITENQLVSLDNLPLTLQQLQSLRASGNRLERLDDRIDLWTEMTYLQLGSECGGNRLVDIPESLARMIKLEELDLSNNQIQNWRLSLPPALKHLKLSGNQLDCLPQDLLLICPSLETLDMSSNRLAFLPSLIGKTYGNTSSALQILDLSNNNIYIVPTTVFTACPHVILEGNPALEYHRTSITRHAQRLRELSNIAVSSSSNNDICFDLALIELMDNSPILPTLHNDKFWIYSTDDTRNHAAVETAKEAILGTLSRMNHQNDTESNHIQFEQGIVFTSKGESWIPSLQELALRSATKLKLRPQSITNKGMPCILLDDMETESACTICACPCVNEWLSAIQVSAYQAYYSVVCKVTLCSTACWLVHHRRTRTPAFSVPHDFLERLMDSAPDTPTPTPTFLPSHSNATSQNEQERDSFQWIVAAATASAAQIESSRALE